MPICVKKHSNIVIVKHYQTSCNTMIFLKLSFTPCMEPSSTGLCLAWLEGKLVWSSPPARWWRAAIRRLCLLPRWPIGNRWWTSASWCFGLFFGPSGAFKLHVRSVRLRSKHLPRSHRCQPGLQLMPMAGHASCSLWAFQRKHLVGWQTYHTVSICLTQMDFGQDTGMIRVHKIPIVKERITVTMARE